MQYKIQCKILMRYTCSDRGGKGQHVSCSKQYMSRLRDDYDDDERNNHFISLIKIYIHLNASGY